ncbi:hypothetical protein [Chryseobacterium oranimense]|uniref:hypothetical protein n=1 Tax=Chryseobacterium oranimense TaxID=421058 RepID=UPI000693DE44|nr:hypothetical protein [Chryseobacterium oranimense]
MTDDEKLALKYHMYSYKTGGNPKMRKMMVDKGWISEQPNIKEFLKDGYEEFELNVAKRIMNEVPEKVFLNNCPKCNKLARTPFARQCRYCGNNWHSLSAAQFKLENSVQITGRPFFLLGQITKGEIKQGQFMDLTILGINKKPKIEAIEFTLKRQNERVWEYIGLGTNELTEEEKEFIKNKGSFRIPFDILNER